MSVRVSKQGPVTTVAIDRPQVRNAVDRQTAQALADAFRAFEADPEARVGVLCGEGGTFCAGADLKAVAQGQFNRVDPEGDGPMGPSRLVLEKPVIAAISGHAVAGGLELALWCDLRVVEEDAVMGVYCRRWGVPLVDGGTQRLPRVVGLGRALEMILLGRAVGAREALGFGLVNAVVPDDRAVPTALEWAELIAGFPQETMLADREAAIRGFGLTLDEGLALERRLGGATFGVGRAGAARFAAGQGRRGAGVPGFERR